MRYAIPTILALALTAVGYIAYHAEYTRTANSNTIQEQPQRERYVPPVWVTNEQGQRCIKQGDVVTCG